jgi:hypothetical protein
MSIRSLEAERQSILERMERRRETYRRMLTDGIDIREASVPQVTVVNGTGSRTPAVYNYSPAPTHFPRSSLMRVISDHPLLCALGVAAVVVIGPRRIAHTVTSSGALMGALSERNQLNIDMIGRLLSMVGAYTQARRHEPRGR